MNKYALIVLLYIYSLLSANYQVYKVKKGDSFYKIGQYYHIDYRQLAKFNQTTRLKAGQLIRIPKYYLYKIKSGDTFISISKKVRVKIDDIKALNPKSTKLYSGRYLKIPRNQDAKIDRGKKRGSELSFGISEARSVPMNEKKRSVPNIPSLKFIWPVNGKIMNNYGERDNIMNYGLVLEVRRKKILATEGGVVSYIGTVRGLGKTMIITHSNNYNSVYAGLEKCRFQVGQKANKGSAIALVRGNRLFFSIFNESHPANPLYFLGNDN